MSNETQLYRKALAPLVEKDMLIITAAGNEDMDLDRLRDNNSTYLPCFMAQIYPSNILCVMATDEEDNRWHETIRNTDFGSNFGRELVDIAAPGRAIYSTVPPLDVYDNNIYAFKTGSSMATPMVAGVGALILSVLGHDTSTYFQGAAARRIIVDSADKFQDLPVRSRGRINAFAAVLQAQASVSGRVTLSADGRIKEIERGICVQGLLVATYLDRVVPKQLSDYEFYPLGDAISLKTFNFIEDIVSGTMDDDIVSGNKRVRVIRSILNISGSSELKIILMDAYLPIFLRIGNIVISSTSQKKEVRVQVSTGGWYELLMISSEDAAIPQMTVDSSRLDMFIAAAVPDNYARSTTLENITVYRQTMAFQSIKPTRIDVLESLSDITKLPYDGDELQSEVLASIKFIFPTTTNGSSTNIVFTLRCEQCSMEINGLHIVSSRDGQIASSGCIRFIDMVVFNVVIKIKISRNTRVLHNFAWTHNNNCTSNNDQVMPLQVSDVIINTADIPSVPGVQCDIFYSAVGSMQIPDASFRVSPEQMEAGFFLRDFVSEDEILPTVVPLVRCFAYVNNGIDCPIPRSNNGFNVQAWLGDKQFYNAGQSLCPLAVFSNTYHQLFIMEWRMLKSIALIGVRNIVLDDDNTRLPITTTLRPDKASLKTKLMARMYDANNQLMARIPVPKPRTLRTGNVTLVSSSWQDAGLFRRTIIEGLLCLVEKEIMPNKIEIGLVFDTDLSTTDGCETVITLGSSVLFSSPERVVTISNFPYVNCVKTSIVITTQRQAPGVAWNIIFPTNLVLYAN